LDNHIVRRYRFAMMHVFLYVIVTRTTALMCELPHIDCAVSMLTAVPSRVRKMVLGKTRNMRSHTTNASHVDGCDSTIDCNKHITLKTLTIHTIHKQQVSLRLRNIRPEKNKCK